MQLMLALTLACAGAAQAVAVAAETTDATETTESPNATSATPNAEAIAAAAQLEQASVRRRNTGSPIDRRVALLAKELGLSTAQQVQVKKVLEGQRDQVARVWDDTSIPAARRVSATQAIGDRTADQIRALLNDEQRKKYIQPRQREAAVGAAGSDVESWMNSGKRK